MSATVFWVVTQRVVLIPCQRFKINPPPHRQGLRFLKFFFPYINKGLYYSLHNGLEKRSSQRKCFVPHTFPLCWKREKTFRFSLIWNFAACRWTICVKSFETMYLSQVKLIKCPIIITNAYLGVSYT